MLRFYCKKNIFSGFLFPSLILVHVRIVSRNPLPLILRCLSLLLLLFLTFFRVFEFGWPDYNYGGVNDLAVIVTSEVYFCISYMVLNMTYKAPVPWINSIYPSSSEPQGGTVVNIRG